MQCAIFVVLVGDGGEGEGEGIGATEGLEKGLCSPDSFDEILGEYNLQFDHCCQVGRSLKLAVYLGSFLSSVPLK